MKRAFTVLAGLALTATVTAGEVSPQARKAIEDTVVQINPQAAISSVQPSPIPGLNEVLVEGTVLYISDDGNYLIHGTMLDVANRKNLTELALVKVRKDLLASIRDEDKIIYRPKGKPKFRVVVFTDISCGYCQQFHRNIQGYLDAGIQVDYVAFPRGGPHTPVMAQMERIWCAPDRNKAYDEAIAGNVPTEPATCQSPVRAQYELGDRIGVQGTPAVFTYDGMQHGGALPPDQLERKLAMSRPPGAPDADEEDVRTIE